MRALILQDDANAAVASSRALIDKGFQILCVDTREVAEVLVRMDSIDILVMDEQVAGQLTHAIALSGELRNPYISSILMTERTGAETDDLYDLIPSLYVVAGAQTAPSLLGQLALASVINTEETQARVARNLAVDLEEKSVPDMLILSNEGEAEVAAADDDEHDIPSTADVIFAVPELAELAQSSACEHDEGDESDDDDDTLIWPKSPDMTAVFANHPRGHTSSVDRPMPA